MTWVSPSTASLRRGIRCLLFLQGFKHRIEAVVSAGMTVRDHAQPRFNRAKTVGRQAAHPVLALAVASDEAGGFQHLDMARNCWLAHLKRFADVHNPDITTREARQNRGPRLISEGSKNTVDVFGGRFSYSYINI